MSKRTDKIAAKAKLAAEKAEQEQQALADKLAAAEAADREAALSSPADKALERAFAKGELPEKDRRALGFAPDGSESPDVIAPVATSEVRGVTGVSRTLEAPSASPEAVAREEAFLAGGPSATPVPPLVPAPSGAPASPAPDGVRDGAPVLAPSVETRGPLVPLVPLGEVHPATVESAVREQRIPNDQINGVFEDKDGVKRDALGHPFA